MPPMLVSIACSPGDMVLPFFEPKTPLVESTLIKTMADIFKLQTFCLWENEIHNRNVQPVKYREKLAICLALAERNQLIYRKDDENSTIDTCDSNRCNVNDGEDPHPYISRVRFIDDARR